MKPTVPHIKHETPVVEVDNTSGPAKRKSSPSRDVPGPSNPVEYVPEAKRQKQAPNVRHIVVKSVYISLSHY